MMNQFGMTFQNYRKGSFNIDDKISMNSNKDKTHNEYHMMINDNKSYSYYIDYPKLHKIPLVHIDYDNKMNMNDTEQHTILITENDAKTHFQAPC